MKKSRISKSIISLALISSIQLGSFSALAQTQPDPVRQEAREKKEQTPPDSVQKNQAKQMPAKGAPSNLQKAEGAEEEVPFYQGTTVGVDIFGLGNKLLGGDYASTEISVEVNLKNRFVPVLEIGYGTTNTTDDETNIHYKASAPFARIGMNYNFFFRKPYLPGFLYGGFRLGYTSFKYDVEAPATHDPNWGTPEVPLHYEDVKTNVTWGELLVGVKVKVYQSFYMGWSVRYRTQFSLKKGEHSEPWYIPGYGTNESTNLGVTYSLIYKLPF